MYSVQWYLCSLCQKLGFRNGHIAAYSWKIKPCFFVCVSRFFCLCVSEMLQKLKWKIILCSTEGLKEDSMAWGKEGELHGVAPLWKPVSLTPSSKFHCYITESLPRFLWH